MQTRLTKCFRHGLLFGGLLFACSSGRLALAQDSYEPDNTVGTASNIGFTASQTNRTIHVTNDVDYACFNADVKHAYGTGMTNIQIKMPGYDDPIQAVFTLFGTNGTTVINADTNDTQIWIGMLAATAGTYYVRAESLGAVGTGSYDLAVIDYGAGDAYEMDNSPNTASNIEAGVSQPRSLNWMGDTDYIKFTNTANHLYLFAVTNYTPTLSLTLYDTNGTTMLTEDDSMSGEVSFEYVLVAPGTYYLNVSSMGATTGTYYLAITDEGVLTGDAYEPDNSVATASNITVGVIQTNRSIHWVGDVDYAAISVTNAHRYVIAATNLGTNLDIEVSLYGTDGTTLLGSTDLGASGENEFLTNTCTITGTNFIKLELVYGTYGTGVYSLVVTDIGSVPSDIYEVDDSAGQASIITPGAPHTNHTIHLTSDVDYLQFTAQADRYYTIETYALDWGLDTFISLYDSTGTNLLAGDNDSGSGLASWLEYKINAAGTYYIKVSANNAGSVGYYSIRLTDTRIREKSWKTRDSLGTLSSPAIGHDGLIYVGSYDSNMYAFAPGGTTSKVWRTGSYIESSPAIASNGSVYIGSDDDRFYCFNTNGITNWISGTTSGDIIGSPALSFDGRIYIGSAAFRFLSFNPDGTTNWTIINLPGAVRVSPAIGTNGAVYIGCDNTNFYSFNPNGTTNWTAKAFSDVRSSAAIDSNGLIYAAYFSGNLYAFNPANGTTNHMWTTGKTIDGSSPVIGANGDIYIGAYSGSTNGTLYSFNPDGATNWSVQFTNSVRSTPLIGCDGTIYIGTDGGYFYAFNPDGTTNFMLALNYAITAAPVMDTNGMLYVAAVNHLFAIYGTSYGAGGLADSPWPMFLHDARHTGALPPPAPADISASDGSFTGQVHITWSATTNTANYEIWRSTNGDNANASCIGVSASSPCDDTSATPVRVYYYWVKAANNSGSSPFGASDSGWRAAPVIEIETPDAPTGVTASDGAFTDHIAIGWNPASNAAAYQVWRGAGASSSAATLLASPSTNNYSDTNVAAGVLYYYWVKAANVHTTSVFSSGDSGWRRSAGCAHYAGADLDGDRKMDLVLFDPETGTWQAKLSGSGYGLTVFLLGGPGCTPVPGDYDGDVKTDPGVYEEPAGLWTVMLSSMDYGTENVTLGGMGYAPVQSDFDGDRKTDLGVYRSATGEWIVRLSAGEYAEAGTIFGGPDCLPVQRDYDGDGKVDPATYNLGNGEWRVMLSAGGYNIATVPEFGGAAYTPVPGDYDGDSRGDPAIYSESTGTWVIMLSGNGYLIVTTTLGGLDYAALPGDYDGDGKTDPAVYNAITGDWCMLLSSMGYDIVTANFGGGGYDPAGFGP